MPGHFFYSKTFTAGGSKSDRLDLDLAVVSGVVHDTVIDFPAGCQYLTHVRIMLASFSVWPRNQAAYYAYEDFQLEIGDAWILFPGQSSLILDGYNTDDSKDHTIRVALQVSDPVLYYAQLGLLDRMDQFIQDQRAILGVV